MKSTDKQSLRQDTLLNTVYLRTFLTVVEAGSYTAAADKLHMSQPAVSQHIRLLEEHLGGVRLFRRTGQRMMPTHAGEELLAGARELMRVTAQTTQNIRALRGEVVGTVNIGCTPGSGEYLLPLLLATFIQQFPAITLSVRVADMEHLLNTTNREGDMLLWVEEQHRRRGWDSQLLAHEPVLLVAPAAHDLLAHTEVAPGTLTEYPLVLPEVGSPLRRLIDDGLRRRGVPLNHLRVVLETDSLSCINAALQAQVGLTFLPQTAVRQLAHSHTITLSGGTLQTEWHLLAPRMQYASLALQETHRFLTSADTRHILQQHGLILPS